MLSSEYYAPSKAPLGSMGQASPGANGLKVGVVYSSPLLLIGLVFILAALDRASGMQKNAWIIIPFALWAIELSLTGRCVGGAIINWSFSRIFAACAIQAVTWMSSFMGSSVLSLWLLNHERATFTKSDITGTLIGVILCTFYALTLAFTVRWRVRVAANV